MFKILIKTINLCLQWNSVPPLLAAVMKCVHGCVHPCFFSQTLVEELSIWHSYFYKDSKFNTIDNLESMKTYGRDRWKPEKYPIMEGQLLKALPCCFSKVVPCYSEEKERELW